MPFLIEAPFFLSFLNVSLKFQKHIQNPFQFGQHPLHPILKILVEVMFPKIVCIQTPPRLQIILPNRTGLNLHRRLTAIAVVQRRIKYLRSQHQLKKLQNDV